jgi:hypothetical protein
MDLSRGLGDVYKRQRFNFCKGNLKIEKNK